MIDLKKIHEMWAKDCVINTAKLDEASRQTPMLHSKYLQILSTAKLNLKKVEIGMKTSKTLNLDEVLKEIDIEELTEEEMDEYLKEKFSSYKEDMLDSADPKIIQFKPRGTFH
jgi:hypothetical protein